MKSNVPMFVFAVSLTLPGAALAQDQAACRDAWTTLNGAASTESGAPAMPQIVRFEDGWCVTNGVSRPLGNSGARAEIGELKWRSDGASSGQVVRYQVQAQNTRLSGPTNEAGFEASLAAAPLRAGLDLSVDANWAVADKELSITDLVVDLGGGETLRLSGKVDGVDLTSPETLMFSAAGASLAGLKLELASKGVFEGLIHEALTGGTGSSPDRQARKQAEAVAWVSDLPTSFIDDASRSSLVDMFETVPSGQGKMVLDVQAPQGLGFLRVLNIITVEQPETPAEVADAFSGVEVSFTYE